MRTTDESAVKAKKGGTLRVNQSESDFDFVDPQLAYRTDDWSMIYTTSMPLVGFPEKSGAAGSQLVPIGATSLLTVDFDVETKLPIPNTMVKKAIGDTLDYLADNLKARAEQLAASP